MTDRAPQGDDRRRELERLVEQYVERLHRGEEIDPTEVLEPRPSWAPNCSNVIIALPRGGLPRPSLPFRPIGAIAV